MNENETQYEKHETIHSGSPTQSPHFTGVCDHWNCTNSTSLGSDYCPRHTPSPGIGVQDRECSEPLCTKTPPVGRDKCTRHQPETLGVAQTPQLLTDDDDEATDDDIEERLTRLEAKLDALLLALDVEPNSAGGEG